MIGIIFLLVEVMKKSNERYFNFPIQLLEGFMTEPREILNNICDYAIYAHSLKLEYGNEKERMKSSASYFKVVLNNKDTELENGKYWMRIIPSNSPMVGMKLDIYWDYYKNDKTDFEKVCLLGFLAIKSILQKKPYCKITNKYWLSRMDGNPKQCKIEELSEPIQKYANEYQTKKIKTELRDNWKLRTYSRYTRGFYISFNLSLDKLVLEAEKRRKSTKEKQYKLKEKAALKKALNEIYETARP